MQRISKGKILSLILACCFLTQAMTCGNSSTTRKVVTAEDDFAQGYKSTAKIVAEAKTSGLLSQADIDVLKPLLLSIGDAHKRVIRLTREVIALGNNIPISKQQELLEALNFISDQLIQLNNEGVLRIKDVNKRVLFNTIVLTMTSAVTSVIITLNLKGS